MTEFIYFVGRFHVLLLHLPIGILSLAVILEVLVRFRRFRVLEVAVAPIWIAGAISAIGTMVLGYLHATESGFEGSTAVEAHRWAGVLLTVSACLIAVLRLRLVPGSRLDQLYARWGWIVASMVMVFMLTVTGHRGGNLTHGETYLVEHAPRPLRQLLGLSSEAPRRKPTDLVSADIYLDVVAPALQQRCSSCHNAGKLKGGLNLATYEALMLGGKDAKAVVPRDLQASDLYRRISLPDDHEEHMPKDGKTPLTPQQVIAVGWWISEGAPKSAAVGKLKKITPEVQSALQQILGLTGETVELASEATPQVGPGDPEAILTLANSGFVVRPIAKDSNLLDVNLFAPRTLTDVDVATLARLGGQIRTLIVANAGLTDAQLKALGPLENLVSLRVDDNPITDDGARTIARIHSLRTLNIYGTAITDAGLDALVELPNLQRLHLWQTKVTEAGASRARAAKPSLALTTAVSFAVAKPSTSTSTSTSAAKAR